MANITISGLQLFAGTESYLKDLKEDEMTTTVGGVNIEVSSGDVGAIFAADSDLNISDAAFSFSF